MAFNSNKWLKVSVVNLLLVALLGVVMRYKIGFDFPYLHQKHLLHAHSHFAFAGWIGHTLMVLLVRYLAVQLPNFNYKRYEQLLGVNLVSSYGMLVFFSMQGYSGMSIFFSTLGIVVSYYFAVLFWKDSRNILVPSPALRWLKGALFFNVISSIGTFALAYMMMSKNGHQEWYLASIYYYLHFQYNGWFFFACAGLFLDYLSGKGITIGRQVLCFWLFFAACIPAYFLSVLWANLPLWVYAITVASAWIQVVVWVAFIYQLIVYRVVVVPPKAKVLRGVYWFIGFAITVKLFLQLGSTLPDLSHLAFGFRPIVIAYLHLVLLAIISLWLLFHSYNNALLTFNTTAQQGLVVFFIGVMLNELVLGAQGILSLSYIPIPYVNVLLFVAALVLFLGTFLMVVGTLNNSKKS
jgi:hypothetical protein